MEKRKEILSAIKMCRFCLSQTTPLTSLFEINTNKNQSSKDSNLSYKILSCLTFEVFPSDRMPRYICDRCKFFMDMFYDFKKICREADKVILKYIRSGSSLQSMSWPKQLLTLYNLSSRKEPIVKTIIEGGATVQVSSQDTSDSEEEDGNIYNIKIGEGNDDEKTTQIKVITSNNQDEDSKTSMKGFNSIPKLARHVRTHAGERSYPCKYCDKSFLKSQHYTRHLRVKHRENVRPIRSQAEAEGDPYRCEQCGQTFRAQDDLIYHSAIHATQNLICPLCEEKFENVDGVTLHIKTHVKGIEFMCDFCELVFTTREKYENHLMIAHEEEIQNELGEEEEMMKEEGDDDEDDNCIQVKDEGDHMVIEIKKPDNFMISQHNQEDVEDKVENTYSEESEPETGCLETSVEEIQMVPPTKANTKESTPEVVKAVPTQATVIASQEVPKKAVSQAAVVPTQASKLSKAAGIIKNQPTVVAHKMEIVKRKAAEQSSEIQTTPKEKITKVESSNSAGFSDKSLRLLEKELQDLKRTNSRSEVNKTPLSKSDTPKGRRQIVTSTPKLRITEEKKQQMQNKSPAVEKKVFERRLTKENKEPRQETKNNGNKREEERERESKETPKQSIVKNGTSDKSIDEGIRRSTRPSKIKDYAKMIRDRSHGNSDDDDDSDMDDEEYTESSPEPRQKRKSSVKPKSAPPTPVPAPAQTPATPAPRKRGRPRKDAPKEVPEKIRKEESISNESKSQDSEEKEANNEKLEKSAVSEAKTLTKADPISTEQKAPASNILLSPTGQTLKKVPIKALPPGVKPLPLPMNARPMGQGELCEMQIGKKVVKVQKIVMTKAEVEAMAKKGLVEMKDGTMVLKQGIKLPTSPALSKEAKDSPAKKEKGTPTRCDLGDD